jgi:hypothetical protein
MEVNLHVYFIFLFELFSKDVFVKLILLIFHVMDKLPLVNFEFIFNFYHQMHEHMDKLLNFYIRFSLRNIYSILLYRINSIMYFY